MWSAKPRHRIRWRRSRFWCPTISPGSWPVATSPRGSQVARTGSPGFGSPPLRAARRGAGVGAARSSPAGNAADPRGCLAGRPRGGPSAFDPVKGHPATIRALVSASRELRDLSPAALAGVGAMSDARRRAGPPAPGGARVARSRVVRRDRPARRSRLSPDRRRRRVPRAGPSRAPPPAGAHARRVPIRRGRSATEAELIVVAGLTDVRRADRAVHRSLDRIGARLDRGQGLGPRRLRGAARLRLRRRGPLRRPRRRRDLRTTPADRVAVLYGADAALRPAAARAPGRGRHRRQRRRHPTRDRAGDRPRLPRRPAAGRRRPAARRPLHGRVRSADPDVRPAIGSRRRAGSASRGVPPWSAATTGTSGCRPTPTPCRATSTTQSASADRPPRRSSGYQRDRDAALAPRAFATDLAAAACTTVWR